jgi:outer membrane biosynthesis protein TonB
MAHLEKVILGNMTRDSDPLYDVKFAEAVRSERVQPKPKPAPAPKPKPKPQPKAAPTPANKPDEDPVSSEPALSGDE